MGSAADVSDAGAISSRAAPTSSPGTEVVDLETTATDCELHPGEVRVHAVRGAFDGERDQGDASGANGRRARQVLGRIPVEQAGSGGLNGVDVEEDDGSQGAFAGTFGARATH